jgi:hypothetical protein
LEQRAIRFDASKLPFQDSFHKYFNDETNNWHWTKVAKTFSGKNLALITKNWQQFPAADDYHARTSMKVSSNSGRKKGSGK